MLAITAGLGGLLSLGGCALFGFAAQALFPPKINAQYEPPKAAPMLILVENRQNPGMSVAESDELTSYIADDLNAYEVCPVVDRTKLQALRDQQEKSADKMSISEIGKAVGAQQVLYVDLRRSSIGNVEGVPLHGRLDIAVHIVDVKSGRTTFPKTSTEAYAMTFETPLTAGGNDPALIRQALLGNAGTSIGRLFHVWYPEGR
jgi:hypothetical protein